MAPGGGLKVQEASPMALHANPSAPLPGRLAHSHVDGQQRPLFVCAQACSEAQPERSAGAGRASRIHEKGPIVHPCTEAISEKAALTAFKVFQEAHRPDVTVAGPLASDHRNIVHRFSLHLLLLHVHFHFELVKCLVRGHQGSNDQGQNPNRPRMTWCSVPCMQTVDFFCCGVQCGHASQAILQMENQMVWQQLRNKNTGTQLPALRGAALLESSGSVFQHPFRQCMYPQNGSNPTKMVPARLPACMLMQT